MKTVVITGSTRGLGFEMAKLFRLNGWNLVINGVNPQRLDKAKEELLGLPGAGAVESFPAASPRAGICMRSQHLRRNASAGSISGSTTPASTSP
ncbi:MAG: SDR family NAD(P)-dependent oxidoreductase [Oscillospiraceae bacterium]|nr:SDR family NAD(P)-dependent oxidoreductase [Oscillospiraceae bacterium]